MHRTAVGLAAIAALTVGTAEGQQQPPPSCAGATHRGFDFWIGTWDVFNPQGRQVGMNTITPELNGCVLHERWQSVGSAHRGYSYNIYDRATARWHQTWVDNSGLLLLLDGAVENGVMVLQGTSADREGQAIMNRITWTPFSRDSVGQLWETSSDDGQTWQTVFDGRYVRR